MAQIRTLADVEAMEATPLANRNLPNNIHRIFHAFGAELWQ